jgi:hypothetical protein
LGENKNNQTYLGEIVMCLIIQEKSKLTTCRNDKVVYKLLIHPTVSRNDCEYVTTFKHMPINIGDTYISDLQKHEEKFARRIEYQIEKGLHSLETFKDILGLQGHLGGFICKCIIPKGAHYYKGKFNVYNSYASDKLTYVEIIKQ